MQESYAEGPANHCGLEPYADDGNVMGVASARGPGRPAIELRNQASRVPTLWCLREGNTLDRVIGERPSGTAESKNLSMSENSKRENREILFASTGIGAILRDGVGRWSACGTVSERYRRKG